jgi:rhodanese-related sulfurtransferase
MDGEITVDELRGLLEETDGGSDSELRVVDIRKPDSFARGHIPGSENVPAPALTDRVETLDGADRVVTVCPHGQASVQAARLVAAYDGIDGPVESLRGGLEAWDGPLERDAPVADRERGGESSAPF